MLKKLTLLAMSVGALVAFAVPASAGAVVLTSEDNPGVAIKSGPITVTGPTLKTTTELGTIECEEVVLHGVVDSSSGDTTKGHGTSGTADGCKFQPGNQPATVTEISVGNIESVGMETTASFSYSAEIPVGGNTITCEFETPEPSPLVATTGTDIAHVAIFLESELCGESEIHGETTWETEDGTPIIFSEG